MSDTATGSFEDTLDRELTRLRTLLIGKRRDYGPGNLPVFGEYGVLVRTYDKVQRLVNLSGIGVTPINESTEDTWLDVAGYAILALMLRSVGPDAFAKLEVGERNAEMRTE